MSVAKVQRTAKAHPAGRSFGEGACPSIGDKYLRMATSGMALSKPCV